MTIKMKDIAWLGGLLEGEGCFRLKTGKYPNIGLEMTDEDTVIKVAAMWDTRVCHHRNMYTTQVSGAYAIQWMLTLYPFLSRYRKERVTKAVKFWREYPYAHATIGIRTMAKCHPNRKVDSRGMCRTCYSAWYRKERLLKVV